MNHELIASVALLLGCATNVAKPGDAAAIANVHLLRVSPPAGSELTTESVLVAKAKYELQN
jgi:hypothetical protein